MLDKMLPSFFTLFSAILRISSYVSKVIVVFFVEVGLVSSLEVFLRRSDNNICPGLLDKIL